MQASHGWLQGLQKQDVSMQASHGWLQGLQKQDVSMQASHLLSIGIECMALEQSLEDFMENLKTFFSCLDINPIKV